MTQSDSGDAPQTFEECLDLRDELAKLNERLRRDVGALRSREKKLLRRLYFHEKSGLPNHALLSRDINNAVSRSISGETKDRFGILFVALDQTFDMLKKSQRSILSEWVLYKTAVSLTNLVKPSGRVYQTKSNEFAILIEGIEDFADCASYVGRVGEVTSKMHRFPGQTISIGCYVGCAAFPDHGESAGEILRKADIALSFSQSSSRKGLVYDPSMTEEITERVALQEGILKALEEQAQLELDAQFSLVYQPLVRVLECNGRGIRTRTVGTECLLRWKHPEWGAISPGRFIPLAEENGLIIPIGNWVFYRAVEQIKRWRESGLNGLYMSVNLSPVQFKDARLVEYIEHLVGSQNIPPDALQLEITETAVMEDPDESLKKIEALREFGIRLSIDDFGTGYSSLGYLKNLRVDTLKIDKSFIDSVTHDTYDQGIVKAVVSMARSLGMEVLAEGVETKEQVEFLFKTGCYKLQGYYFSKPLATADFDTYIMQS